MPFNIRRVDYYYTTVEDQPGEAYRLLSTLAEAEIDLLAFTAVPVGPVRTQLSIFPSDSAELETVAGRAGLALDGPHPALLVQGDDELGALAEIHEQLYRAGVNVYASSGVTDGDGAFGYVLYVRPEEYKRAAEALEV
ncbi:MAG: hypothetical protein GWM90_02075 [Gemmatimonadetes bacterium]|nr:hypothetical protein [Gemmatimonadota bacterium]NIQ52399.1 hypothetical protein [Gemmatimonadota bacterium]NIU72525.1 hypothetical protein [Gammaproteobacteria bacterium]NIX42956.1 hypothetical protein [Gemmatimonadota bacterium]NIY07137.1 hypothetical protein [Gemmatimonadota bacterium]